MVIWAVNVAAQAHHKYTSLARSWQRESGTSLGPVPALFMGHPPNEVQGQQAKGPNEYEGQAVIHLVQGPGKRVRGAARTSRHSGGPYRARGQIVFRTHPGTKRRPGQCGQGGRAGKRAPQTHSS